MEPKSINSPLQLLPECRLDYSPLTPFVRLTPLFIV